MKYSQPTILGEKENQILAEWAPLSSGELGGAAQPPLSPDRVFHNENLANLPIDALFDEDDLKLLDQVLATGVLIY